MIEDTAKRLGWSPKDKYRGPEGKWKDAPEYIEFVNSEFPVMRERLRTVTTRNAELERQASVAINEVGELKTTLEEFKVFSEKRDQRAYLKARKDLQAEMDAAVDASNPQAYKEAKRSLEELDDEARAAAVEEQKTRREQRRDNGQRAEPVHPDVTAWLAENPWFNQDPILNVTAMAIHGTLKQQQPGMSLKDNLEETKRQVAKAFPEKFGVKPKKDDDEEEPVARVNAPSGEEDRKPARRRNAKRGYDDLPADAKKTCDRFIKQKMVKSREAYCEDYFADEE